MSSAVSDAGPLIHLAEVGALPLLGVFDTVHIPRAVWSETVGAGRVAEAAVLALDRAERHDVPTLDLPGFVRAHRLEELQAGEREALYLSTRLGVAVLLTDDLAVRDAAKRLSLTPVGSLGVVVRAYHLGRLSLAEAERHLARLFDVSSLFVTPAIVDLAVERLRGGQT